VPSSRRLACPSCSVRPAARRCSAASRSAMSRLRCAWEHSTATQVSARSSASSSTRPRHGSLFRRTAWSASRVRSKAERGPLAQPAQRARLTAALAPARQHFVQLLAVGHSGQHLNLSTAIVDGTEPHQIQLARVADPRRSVKRPVSLLAPPKPYITLARVDATVIGGVEARQRAIALALLGVSGCNCLSHRTSPAFGRRARGEASPMRLNSGLPSGKDCP
jgi:hypothetical protein